MSVLTALLAPAASTGNLTGTQKSVPDYAVGQPVAFVFVVEAIGASPTVTYKFQGSFNGSDWFDVAYITDAVDTLAVTTRVATTVSATVQFLSTPTTRFYRFYRVVTTANTNVTFRAEMYVPDDH